MYTHVSLYICIYIHLHTYVYIWIHMHIHAYAYIPFRGALLCMILFLADFLVSEQVVEGNLMHKARKQHQQQEQLPTAPDMMAALGKNNKVSHTLWSFAWSDLPPVCPYVQIYIYMRGSGLLSSQVQLRKAT